MTDYDNTNTGALFKNDKDGNDKRPDYRGQLDVEGTEYWVSAWLRKSKKGETFMSLRIQQKGEKQEKAKPEPARPADYDDDIPF